MTFNLVTPKSISVFLFLSSICVWSMKFVGWGIFKLSHYNKVWTDRQTDRRTDGRTDGRTNGRTDRVITIGLPHLRWRGPNCIWKKIYCDIRIGHVAPPIRDRTKVEWLKESFRRDESQNLVASEEVWTYSPTASLVRLQRFKSVQLM